MMGKNIYTLLKLITFYVKMQLISIWICGVGVKMGLFDIFKINKFKSRTAELESERERRGFKKYNETKATIIHSDWHIHSEYSYDAEIPLKVVAEYAKKQGFKCVGITDHANFNDKQFISDITSSAAAVREAQKEYPFMYLGVELTPFAKPMYDYILKHGDSEGYVPSEQSLPYDMEMSLTKEDLTRLGIQYAIGAVHWRVDVPFTEASSYERDASIKDWHRQQLWLAEDERVTILGHPWDNFRELWFDDFTVIPKAMRSELGVALKQYGKCVECNPGFFLRGSEKFHYQYAEYMRELFEMGIPIVYGSDAHTLKDNLGLYRTASEKCLAYAGFKDGDISELPPSKFWLK